MAKDPAFRAAEDNNALVASPPAPLLDSVRRYGPTVAGYALPFVLVVYLALRGGGYDAIVRGELGIAVWWIVLLGALVGVLPAARVDRTGWLVLGLTLAFACWTAAGIGWSDSAERTVAEIGRVGTYLGVFTLALIAQRRDALKRFVYAVGAAIAVVGFLALLSRLHPAWFPEDDAARVLPEVRGRLSYPLNYWNGLAALIAIGTPLLLWIATEAKRVVTRTVAAAVIPAVMLAAFYTLSRGGALELTVALSVFIALHPRRLAMVPTLLVVGAGAAILIAAGAQRQALADGLSGRIAERQADEMLALLVVVCAGVALLQAAIALAARHNLGPRPTISRSAAMAALVSIVVIGGIAAIGVGAPSTVSDSWQEFKAPGAPENNATTDRFVSASGNGRYQYWQSSVDAAETSPLNGIGPGTWGYWWAREGTLPGSVRDSHSLFFEVLAELGIIGLILIGGIVGSVLAVGTRRALRAPPARRALFAAAVGGSAAFATAAAVDWGWEIAVIPVAFLLLAAGILAPESHTEAPADKEKVPMASRLGLIGLSILGALVIGIPLVGTSAIRASQESARAGQLEVALEEARKAQDWQPFAATPHLQEALVLELIAADAGADADDVLQSAVAAATQAARDEPTNWQTWLVLSRIQESRGDVESSTAAYETAKSLNPRSPLFADG
jgi:O-Antigen ligase